MYSTMPTLDIDVIFTEILPRLPAKSLMRFKCVSKSFKTLISSRDFDKLYLRYNPSQLLILPGDSRIKCYDLDTATATATITLHYIGPVSVVGSVNGVLCIHTPQASNHLLVLNPTTRTCVDILIPKDMPNLPGYTYTHHFKGVVVHFLGFAFDHENHDFKVVRVSVGQQKDAVKIRVAAVYSLNNNSWKVVGREVRTDSLDGSPHGGTLINSHLLHWMFWNYTLGQRRIGCFDVCKNKWVDDVLLPHYYYTTTYENNLILLEIGLLDDLLSSSFERAPDCYDVWVMKEYGVQDSWVKLFSIPLSVGLPGVVPVACRGGFGDILLRQRHSTLLFWYNLMDGVMTKAKFDGPPDFSGLKVYMGGRSLVYLPGGKPFGPC